MVSSQAQPVAVVEFTDAMCSWAWGTEPKLRLLRWRFDDQIASWRHVMGHLVEDEHLPDGDRVADAPKLQAYWKVVCDITGMPRPDPLERTTGGSRASGVLVKAAQRRDGESVETVLRALREATFVAGTPPDTPERAVAACRHALDDATLDELTRLAADDAIADAYAEDIDETRRPNDHVLHLEGDRPGIGRARQAQDGRMRFVFPTLLIRSAESEDGGVESTVPGWMPYEDYERAMFAAGAVPSDRTRSRPTPAEAFARWPSLAEAELAFLCGEGAELPPDVETTSAPGGTFHRRSIRAPHHS